MEPIDLTAFHAAPLTRSPFSFTVVPGFLKSAALPAVRADFPDIRVPGLFPVSELSFGPGFRALIEKIQGARMAAAFGAKFGIDLSRCQMMITVRGHCQKKDGRIHTDMANKVVTALLYLNDEWDASGGRLRFLRGPDDLDDAIAEVPPDGGTLVAFRRSDCSWHGHEPYTGVRRYIMFNWMSDVAAAERELSRHRRSARLKRIVGWSGGRNRP